jgi:hypothetical protein
MDPITIREYKLKNIKSLVLIFAVMLLTACASTPNGPKFSSVNEITSPEKSLLYIYRPGVYYGKAITYPVLLNENKIADIGHDGYFSIEVDPGEYNIRPDTASIDHDLSINLAAGTTTYLKLKTNERFALCFCSSLQFVEMDKRMALQELRNTKEEVARVYFK